MTACPVCGSETSGKFCAECGTPLATVERAETSGPQRSRMTTWLALTAVVVLLGGAGVATLLWPDSSTEPENTSYTIHGMMAVTSSATGDDYACAGMVGPEEMLTAFRKEETLPCPEGPGGGFSDIADGTDVTVSDAGGTVLAIGELSGGRLVGGLFQFQFDFEVHNVPDSAIYQVEVSHRGQLRYTREDMETKGWSVVLTLG